jgi:hypothetical protein
MKHKKLIISLSVVSAIVLIATVVIVFKNKSSNKKSVEIWHQVVLASNNVGGFASNSVSESNTEDLLSAAVDMNSKLDDAKFNTDKLSYILVGSDRKTEMDASLTKIKDYNSELKTAIDKINAQSDDFDESSMETLKSLNEDMKKSVEEMLTQVKFSENLNNNYYESFTYADSLNEKVNDAKSEEDQKKQAEDDEAAAVESSKDIVDSFLGDYTRKDFAGMKSNMTSGFQNEFKFSEIESGWDSSHPKSYRVLNSEKSGNNYVVSANVTYLSSYQDQDGNATEQENTVTEKYRVVKSDSGAYLVDGQVYN